MKQENYPKAATEVLEILNCLSKSDVKKIPQELMEFLEEIKDNNYNYKITIQDIRNHFLGVTLLDETKAILAVIFRDYWATNYQRKKIIEKENHDKQKDKNEKFDFDNLFKKKEKEF